MKSNADKCHILVNSNEKLVIKISSHENANTKREKLLGVHLDGRLTFDYQNFQKSKTQILWASQSNIRHKLI